ncbi:MAG: hypothetical protein OXN25_14960 [Candidatus Poribacteria bacterium]|nr:hypothetical protein [Candidatus Poribacteria bacterium]
MSDNAGLKLIKQVIEYGSIIGSPLASNTLQGIIPEEVLEIGIPTLANSLKNIGQEYAERMLSPRENLRVGSALILAAEGIRERLKNENPREDGFFDKNHTGRADAEEVLENMVLKVQREPEEKKARYIAKIYENSVFEQEISADLSHKIIKSAEQLTYQHLCILSMVGRREKGEDALRDLQLNPQLDHPLELSKLLHDCFELVTNGYIQGGLTFIFNGRLPQYETLNPNSMLLESIGKAIFDLMNLQDISEKDIKPIAKLLGWEKKTASESGEVSWNPKM